MKKLIFLVKLIKLFSYISYNKVSKMAQAYSMIEIGGCQKCFTFLTQETKIFGQVLKHLHLSYESIAIALIFQHGSSLPTGHETFTNLEKKKHCFQKKKLFYFKSMHQRQKLQKKTRHLVVEKMAPVRHCFSTKKFFFKSGKRGFFLKTTYTPKIQLCSENCKRDEISHLFTIQFFS